MTFLGYSLNHWSLHIMYVMIIFMLMYYGIKLYLFLFDEIRYYNYLKTYRKFITKKDVAKDIDFKYREKIIKEGKL